MGNRAVVTFSPKWAVYIHWNGGRASIEGFLDAMRQLNLPRSTPAEAVDSLAKVMKSFLGDSTVEVGPRNKLDYDNGDNGEYVVNLKLQITRRRYRRDEEEISAVKTAEVCRWSVEQFDPQAKYEVVS